MFILLQQQNNFALYSLDDETEHFIATLVHKFGEWQPRDVILTTWTKYGKTVAFFRTENLDEAIDESNAYMAMSTL